MTRDELLETVTEMVTRYQSTPASLPSPVRWQTAMDRAVDDRRAFYRAGSDQAYAAEVETTEWDWLTRADLMFAVKWAENGSSSLTCGHKLAASLMATRVPWENLPDLRAPWRAFTCVVPRGLFAFEDAFGKRVEVDHVRIAIDDDGSFGYVAVYLDDGTQMFTVRAGKDDDAFDLREGLRRADSETRIVAHAPSKTAIKMAIRFAIGLIIHIDASGQFSKAQASSAASERKRVSSTPTAFTFSARGDVRVDCRAWVAARVSRGRADASVQCMVRGHWKRQAWGPAGQLRKWIHVEPYWRGPEDAPIALRSHVVGST